MLKDRLLRRIAHIESTYLDAADSAFNDLLAAFEVSADDGLGPELARLADRCDGWGKLLERYSYVAGLQDGPRAYPLFCRLGDWRLRVQEDPRSAAAAYRQALTVEPADLETGRKLQALLLELSRPQECLEVMERALAHIADIEGRVRQPSAMARFCQDELADQAGAERHWHQVPRAAE